jgi:hypothetical protein
MASDLDYQALFAKSVATSPRAAAGQLYPYDFAVGHPAAEAFPFQEFIEATARALDKEGRELAPYMPALSIWSSLCQELSSRDVLSILIRSALWRFLLGTARMFLISR